MIIHTVRRATGRPRRFAIPNRVAKMKSMAFSEEIECVMYL